MWLCLSPARSFESGAIVLHIAETHARLLPKEPAARARAITWLFAAVGTIEPATFEFGWARVFEASQPWAAERLPLVEGRVRPTFAALEDRLTNAGWLDGAFSAGDLMMISVLMRLGPSGVLAEFPALAAYVSRGEARSAFKRLRRPACCVHCLADPLKEADNARAVFVKATLEKRGDWRPPAMLKAMGIQPLRS